MTDPQPPAGDEAPRAAPPTCEQLEQEAAERPKSLLLLPRITPWFFVRLGSRVSEPQIKFVLVILFMLGGLANTAKSEAVLRLI